MTAQSAMVISPFMTVKPARYIAKRKDYTDEKGFLLVILSTLLIYNYGLTHIEVKDKTGIGKSLKGLTEAPRIKKACESLLRQYQQSFPRTDGGISALLLASGITTGQSNYRSISQKLTASIKKSARDTPIKLFKEVTKIRGNSFLIISSGSNRDYLLFSPFGLSPSSNALCIAVAGF